MDAKLRITLCATLLLAGCSNSPSQDNVPAENDDLKQATRVVDDYARAVLDEDLTLLGKLSVYIDDETDTVRSGDELPTECLDQEVKSLKSLQIDPNSASEISTVGGSPVIADESGELPETPQGLIGQIPLKDGTTVGRGIMAFADEIRVQIQPSQECDSALSTHE